MYILALTKKRGWKELVGGFFPQHCFHPSGDTVLFLALPPSLTPTHGCQTTPLTSWSFRLCLSVSEMGHISTSCMTAHSQTSLLANIIVGVQICAAWWF